MNIENTKIAYTDIIILENGGYLGAVLITDHKGFPLEFRYTDPIIPTKIQKVLYGKGIQKYIKVDVILDSLLKVLSNNFDFIVIEDEELLTYEGKLPANMLRISGTKSPVLGEKSTLSKVKNSEYLLQTNTSHHPIRLQFQESFACEGEQFHNIISILCELSEIIDVQEPLSRVRKSIELICKKEL